MEVTLENNEGYEDLHIDQDVDDDFEDVFRYNRPSILPCNASDLHGIYHGICFMFNNEQDVEYAHTHILKDPFFITFLEKWGKYFHFNVENPWRINEDSSVDTLLPN